MAPNAGLGGSPRLGEWRAIKVDIKRGDLSISYPEHLSDMAVKCRATRRLKLVSRQSASSVSINNKISDLHCGDHREKALCGLEICTFTRYLLDGADKASECHSISQECLPAALLLEASEVALDGVFGHHVAFLLLVVCSPNRAANTCRLTRPS